MAVIKYRDSNNQWQVVAGGGGSSVSPYTSTPAMDGTASAGSSDNYSRGDHIHPTDTSRQAKVTANGLLKGDGDGGVSAAVAGTDYQAPLTAGTDYQIPLGSSGSTSLSGILKGNGSKVVTATAGTDYMSPISAYTSTPAMDGTGSAGSGTAYARGNHVHPTDTSRQAKITASGILKGDGDGGVSAATGGTDYARMSDLPSVPSAYTSTPAMDGTGSAGSSTAWARGDHVHPTDTGRQAKITANGLLKGDGDGGVTAATAGTDYQTPVAYITYCTFYKTVDGNRVQTGISDAEVCVFDDTFSDIKNAYDAGQVVVMFGRDTYELALVGCSSTQIRFSMLASTQSMFTVAYNSTDTNKESTSMNYIAIQKRIHQDGSVTLTGMLKGDGSKVLAATADTDYVAPFIATGTTTNPDNASPTVTISTTFADIKTAYTSNKRVILRLTNSSYTYELPLTMYSTSNIRFSGQVVANRTIYINLASNGTVTVTTHVLS